MVHIRARRSPSLWLILKLIAIFAITIARSRDFSCILPIVERRRLVSERPSFVMRLFKRPACRETQASRITNTILRHHHRRFATSRRVQGVSSLTTRGLVENIFIKIYKMSNIAERCPSSDIRVRIKKFQCLMLRCRKSLIAPSDISIEIIRSDKSIDLIRKLLRCKDVPQRNLDRSNFNFNCPLV